MVAAVKPGLKPGVTVLVKGSRVNRLERVTAALVEPGLAAAAGGH
jgi:UDP-N-acetylmuramyl pentapeptide synthase